MNTSNSTRTSRTAQDSHPTLLLGFDWGTNMSCLLGAHAGESDLIVNEQVPTVVGYAKAGIVNDLLPNNAQVLFGHQANQYRLHLILKTPMVDGVLADMDAARDFARHLRSLIQVEEGTEIRAVIGVPANAEPSAREDIRQAVSGFFQRVICIPEPFLAALGYRDEERLNDSTYVDPVRNSMFIDIGAGTTDVCLVQGYYPTAADQISFSFAGDKVDELLDQNIRQTYPDCELTKHKIREIKEQFSWVGKSPEKCIASVMIHGKARKLDVTEQVGAASTALLQEIFKTVKDLIPRASSDTVEELLRNIILTGGGSCIRGLDTELQRLLVEDGYEKPVVKLVGEKYKEFVARGALKAARSAREDQWQQLVK
jgi:rod shape-determining protein MreB and related proteins